MLSPIRIRALIPLTMGKYYVLMFRSLLRNVAVTLLSRLKLKAKKARLLFVVFVVKPWKI